MLLNISGCFCVSYRLLATEQWHQDKRLLAKEMSQLHKLQMQKVLFNGRCTVVPGIGNHCEEWPPVIYSQLFVPTNNPFNLQ